MQEYRSRRSMISKGPVSTPLVKISRTLFRQLNKLQVNDPARVIPQDEPCALFEKSRFGVWVGADVRRPTRLKQPIAATKIMFWVRFTPIGIVDIVMLPPAETFDRSFLVEIAMDSLKKKLA
jgi:hypothetical protein